MREIKFRAWDTTEEKMWYKDGDFPTYLNEFRFNDYMKELQKDDVILMQYVGLKDKNGKEIYEGDVVKYEGEGRHQVVYGHHTIGEFDHDDYPTVEYKTSCFAIKYDDNSGYTGLDDPDEIEIIGNIYENPNLSNVIDNRR